MVAIASLVQTRLLESWQHYQQELERVIAPLTDEQMSLRLVPGIRSLGEIAEHIVRARALWLPVALSEGDFELKAELKPLSRWDEPDDPPRTQCRRSIAWVGADLGAHQRMSGPLAG